jgi:A/G-specific adenine glycosylase
MGPVIPAHIEPEQLEQFIEKVTDFGALRLDAYPWRLESDPYRIFVAEVLLQRTKTRQVVPIYENFIKKFPTIHSLASATVEEVMQVIKPLGLAYRARRLKSVASILVERYGGRFPEQLDVLLKLPGVGSYIAGILLCFAFNKRFPVLDSNVKRVLSRVFGIALPADAHKRPEVLRMLERFFPSQKVKEFVAGLLDLGITVCLPRNPRCELCPLKNICRMYSFPRQ